MDNDRQKAVLTAWVNLQSQPEWEDVILPYLEFKQQELLTTLRYADTNEARCVLQGKAILIDEISRPVVLIDDQEKEPVDDGRERRAVLERRVLRKKLRA